MPLPLNWKDVGEKQFTVDTPSFRNIRRELSIGKSVILSTPYWKKPTSELNDRLEKIGLKLIEQDQVGTYKILRFK